MIFLLQRTGQGKNFFVLNFLYVYYVNDIFIAENWAGQELLRPRVFFVWIDVNDIFITEFWAGRELLHPKYFVWM